MITCETVNKSRNSKYLLKIVFAACNGRYIKYDYDNLTDRAGVIYTCFFLTIRPHKDSVVFCGRWAGKHGYRKGMVIKIDGT